MTQLSTNTAISPIDWEYRKITAPLAWEFSEFWLIKTRVEVEVLYLIHFAQQNIDTKNPSFTDDEICSLKSIYESFSLKDAQRIKDIEIRWIQATETTKGIKATNHDVKAVEYFVREKIQWLWLWSREEFVHLGLTSQDINNTAVPLSIHRATTQVLLPLLEETLESISWNLKIDPKTKESLQTEINNLKTYIPSGKFWGATGWYNALHIAYPWVDWPKFWDSFLRDKLWLKRQQFTTQIEHYDLLMSHFNTYKRIGSILRKIAVLSSHEEQPNKNLSLDVCIGTMSAYIEHFSRRLPVSRHQRDLTDSTVSRNFWVPFAYMVIALKKLKNTLWKGNDSEIILSGNKDSLTPLTAIGASDGRYRQRVTAPLASYFSESSESTYPNDEIKINTSLSDIINPALKKVQGLISKKAQEYKGIAMLAYTHGQTATPTNLWKEFQVFVERLEDIFLEIWKSNSIDNV